LYYLFFVFFFFCASPLSHETDMASTTIQAKPDSQYHVVAYNTSKAALNSYTVALARSFPEAKVNAVTPGIYFNLIIFSFLLIILL
jgi:NAD(P)-dependent dehydrogenase (short-subunit alcohol dehydrogenase family)